MERRVKKCGNFPIPIAVRKSQRAKVVVKAFVSLSLPDMVIFVGQSTASTRLESLKVLFYLANLRGIP